MPAVPIKRARLYIATEKSKRDDVLPLVETSSKKPPLKPIRKIPTLLCAQSSDEITCRTGLAERRTLPGQ